MSDNFKCPKCGSINPLCEYYSDRLQEAEARIEKLLDAINRAGVAVDD